MNGQLAGSIAGALAAIAWAALLALTDGALAAEPKLAETALPRGYAEKPERLRRALALGRIILLALAAIALSEASRWWNAEPLVAAFSLVVLVGGLAIGGDLLPRTFGLWQASRLGPSVVPFAAATLALLLPVFVAAGIIDRALARLFGVRPARKATADPAQRDMLLGVFTLADTTVSEVMTPRVDVIGLEAASQLDEVVQKVAAAEHARLPVFDGDLDHIVGVLYAKDLLPGRFGAVESRDWRALVRPVGIVPEVKTLDQQLRDFQRGISHMAVVVDEFGGTAGVVTLENVLEEIVGEIRDEYDPPEGQPIIETAPGVFTVAGNAPLDELVLALGLTVETEDVSTAGGWVYSALGHVPETGETVDVPGWRVTIERVEKRRIARLRFDRVAPSGPA